MSTHKVCSTLGCFLFIIVALFLFVTYTNVAVPPPAIPPDGHDVSQLLATGSITQLTDEESAELFRIVAGFHDQLNDPTVAANTPGESCLACHSDILDKEFVQRKMPNEDGSLVVTEEINHHRIHSTQEIINEGNFCTYCHSEFQITFDDAQVTIAGYVEKTTCAACHSRFAPRRLMELSLAEISKNPEEFGEDASCTCHCCHFGWSVQHDVADISNRFVETLRIGDRAEDCLVCHGENSMIMPRFIQDIYWGDR